jgi:hypothetical protein
VFENKKKIYNIDGIVREHKTVCPISSLDDSCCEMSDITQNIPSFGLDYSKILVDVGTAIQKAADIIDCNKDSTQSASTVRGTLKLFVAHEDGPFVMCPKTKEIYENYGA